VGEQGLATPAGPLEDISMVAVEPEDVTGLRGVTGRAVVPEHDAANLPAFAPLEGRVGLVIGRRRGPGADAPWPAGAGRVVGGAGAIDLPLRAVVVVGPDLAGIGGVARQVAGGVFESVKEITHRNISACLWSGKGNGVDLKGSVEDRS